LGREPGIPTSPSRSEPPRNRAHPLLDVGRRVPNFILTPAHRPGAPLGWATLQFPWADQLIDNIRSCGARGRAASNLVGPERARRCAFTPNRPPANGVRQRFPIPFECESRQSAPTRLSNRPLMAERRSPPHRDHIAGVAGGHVPGEMRGFTKPFRAGGDNQWSRQGIVSAAPAFHPRRRDQPGGVGPSRSRFAKLAGARDKPERLFIIPPSKPAPTLPGKCRPRFLVEAPPQAVGRSFPQPGVSKR